MSYSNIINSILLNFLEYKRRGLILAGFRFIKRCILSRLGVLQLSTIFICPSHECNSDCAHCYEKFSHEKLRCSLTTQQAKNIIDQFLRLGGCSVYFCSGEFLLRDDALELIKYARSKSMAVFVVTNGLLLNESKIVELKKVGMSDLVVSIDSANPFRHDELRGVKGCFEKAVNGLIIAKKKGIITHIWTYVTKTNFNELDGISRLAKELRVSVFIYFPLLSGHLFNRFDENLTYEEREILRQRFNKVSHLELEFKTEKSACRGGGKQHICVMPSGDVTFCPPVPFSYGNIKSKSIKNCLKDIMKDYERFSHCTGQCIVNFPEYRQKRNAKFMYE
ncbi:radical SAM protein [bacterium]|nr:radical SAM protein [bacterium]